MCHRVRPGPRMISVAHVPDVVLARDTVVGMRDAFAFVESIYHQTTDDCLDTLERLACEIMFPECNPKRTGLVQVCRGDCYCTQNDLGLCRNVIELAPSFLTPTNWHLLVSSLFDTPESSDVGLALVTNMSDPFLCTDHPRLSSNLSACVPMVPEAYQQRQCLR